MKDESAVRLDLSNYACDICCSIEVMTKLWKESGLSWNTDILSKFYVMSLLAKDIKQYLYEETEKDNKAENEKEAHKKKIDGIIEALETGVTCGKGFADIDVYANGHCDVSWSDINEAVEFMTKKGAYKLFKPVLEVDSVINKAYLILASGNHTYEEACIWLFNKLNSDKKKEDE